MMRALNRQTISYIKKINKKLIKKQLLVLVSCKKTIFLHFFHHVKFFISTIRFFTLLKQVQFK
jgi:hypothetical protein